MSSMIITALDREVQPRLLLYLYVDIQTYLTQQTPGHPPVIDKEKFMRNRAANARGYARVGYVLTS